MASEYEYQDQHRENPKKSTEYSPDEQVRRAHARALGRLEATQVGGSSVAVGEVETRSIPEIMRAEAAERAERQRRRERGERVDYNSDLNRLGRNNADLRIMATAAA